MERESMIETKQHLLWVKPRYLGLPWVNRQREKYLGLSHHLIHDGCLFGQEPLAARDCIAQHQTQCSLWAQTEVHVSYMRTVWWEDPSQEASGKIYPWTSRQREHLFSCIHEASGKKQEESTEKTAEAPLLARTSAPGTPVPSPSSLTQNRKKEHRTAQDERSDKISLLYSIHFRPRPFSGSPAW